MLRQRLSTGIPLAILALLSFCLPGWPGAVLFIVLSASFLVVALREYFTLMSRMGSAGYPGTTVLAAGALLAGTLIVSGSGPGGALHPRVLLVDTTVIVVFLCAVWGRVLRSGPSPESIHRLLVSLGGLLYVAWPALFIAKLYFGEGASGRLLASYLILVTKLADVGAFAVGSATARRPGGNHKLFPRISPKKSWEGLAGGLFTAVLASVLAVLAWGDSMTVGGEPLLGLSGAVLFGVASTLLGLLGDVAESALKRAAGAKDSGSIPGLGGVLDILDSLVFVAPVFFLYVSCRVLAG